MPSQQPQLQSLSALLSESELRTLCFNIGIDYEDIMGATKTDKLRGLLIFLQQRNQIDKLFMAGKVFRPDIHWDQFKDLFNSNNHFLPQDYKMPSEETLNSNVPNTRPVNQSLHIAGNVKDSVINQQTNIHLPPESRIDPLLEKANKIAHADSKSGYGHLIFLGFVSALFSLVIPHLSWMSILGFISAIVAQLFANEGNNNIGRTISILSSLILIAIGSLYITALLTRSLGVQR